MTKKFNISHYTYIGICFLTLLLAYLHESELLPTGYLKTNAQAEYSIQLFCIIITLGESWSALRLFNSKKVKKDIDDSFSALTQWNIIRILMVGIPILINLEAYYALFNNQSILYCFLITLIAFVFCWPKSRQD